MAITTTPYGQSIDNTFTGPLPADIIPVPVRPAVEHWEEFYAKTVEANDAVTDARAAVGRAPTEDGKALKAALLAGKADPGQKHQTQAEKDLAAAERTFTAYNEILRDKATALLTQLREHRDGIHMMAAATLEPAVTEYLEAVTAAQTTISAVQAKVSNAYVAVTLLEALDSGRNTHISISTPSIPSPDFTAGLTVMETISSNIEETTEPLNADRFTLTHEDGRTMTTDSSSLEYLAKFGWTAEPIYSGHQPTLTPAADPRRSNDAFHLTS